MQKYMQWKHLYEYVAALEESLLVTDQTSVSTPLMMVRRQDCIVTEEASSLWEHTWTATWTHIPLQCLHLTA